MLNIAIKCSQLLIEDKDINGVGNRLKFLLLVMSDDSVTFKLGDCQLLTYFIFGIWIDPKVHIHPYMINIIIFPFWENTFQKIVDNNCDCFTIFLLYFITYFHLKILKIKWNHILISFLFYFIFLFDKGLKETKISSKTNMAWRR